MPTTPEPTEKETEFFPECPDEAEDGSNYREGDAVSYRTSGSMWKVYQCLGGTCDAGGLGTEGPAEEWSLLGQCAPTNDQLKSTHEDAPQVNITEDHLDGHGDPEI
jgi:hypothetical protein